MIFTFYFFTKGDLEIIKAPGKWQFEANQVDDCLQLSQSIASKMLAQEQENPQRILINIIPSCVTDEQFDKEMGK